MTTVDDTGTEFEQIAEHWTTDEARPVDQGPKRRGQGRQPKGSAPALGRIFTKFEAKSLVKDLTARIAAIREDNSEDEYAAMYVEMRVELLQELIDHLQLTVDKK